jgi:sugar/nucleoside kinase (ribokinase family)
VIFSDFRHGIFNRGSIPHLTKAVLSDVMKVADSQVASRWGNILEFNGFDMITPNEKEARFALGDQDSNIRRLAWDIYSVAKCKTLMMKLGSRGMLAQVNDQAEVIVLDSFARNVVDPVGAGDAFLAYATLGIFTGSVEKAAVLGSIAAALECEHEGNVPITADMMRERLNETRALLSR